MNARPANRILLALLGAATLSIFAASPAIAGGTTSLGHGVKCSWVLVSSINGANTYNWVCTRRP